MGKIKFEIQKSPRIDKLIDHLYANMPEIEADRAELVTESYKETEGLPVIKRRSAAFNHILRNIPIVIRPDELIVGSNSIAPRGCQTFPEYSFEWLEPEFDTIATREADPFYISPATADRLKLVHPYWKGKTVSDLAAASMDPDVLDVFLYHGVFTVGNYFYNGVGHINVNYAKVINYGLESVIAEAQEAISKLYIGDGDYLNRKQFLEAVVESCEGVIAYAHRYAELARKEAMQTNDRTRKAELIKIADNCERVPAKSARNFYEACQSFWFIQQLLQCESSGHSISPGRFDQYMYPFLKKDLESGNTTYEQAQEYIDQYLAGFPRVDAYLKDTVRQAYDTGYVTTVFGRKRYIPELMGKNKMQQKFGERVAMNSPIQGAAADLIKIAMVRVHDRLKREGLNARLILQVHDELLIEAHRDCAERAELILREEMENAASLAVPLTVEIHTGDTWYDAK